MTYDEYFKLQYYLTDEEFFERTDEWDSWFADHAPNTPIVVGSSSWATDRRFVTFLFERKEDAALFRMFYDGKVVS